MPSARNSGLESTWKACLELDSSTRAIAAAVLTGTVDFSTMICAAARRGRRRGAADVRRARRRALGTSPPRPEARAHLGALRDARDVPARQLPVLQVCRLPRADARLFRWRVHRDEDDVGLADGGVDVGAEEEILAARRLHDLLQPRLVDGQALRVPRGDSPLGEVADSHLDVGAHLGDDRHGRAANVARAEAADPAGELVGARHVGPRALLRARGSADALVRTSAAGIRAGQLAYPIQV